MFWILLCVAVVLALFIYVKFFKVIKVGSMTLVTGGVKTGKSTLAVYLSIKAYKKERRRVFIYNKVLYPVFHLFFKKMKLKEIPLYYSNIPVAVKGYCPLTTDLILRKTRFRYRSIIYICESSLVADSMSFKDQDLNENMLLLNKLIGHETRGGKIFYDTQAIGDNHFAIKRCVSSVLYIHHAKKFPFFYVAFVRELKYSDDGNSVNTFDSDVEDTLKMVLIPKSVWKCFDCYCYSALTDKLPVESRQKTVLKKDKKKVNYILTFKKFLTVRTKEDCHNAKDESKN